MPLQTTDEWVQASLEVLHILFYSYAFMSGHILHYLGALLGTAHCPVQASMARKAQLSCTKERRVLALVQKYSTQHANLSLLQTFDLKTL